MSQRSTIANETIDFVCNICGATNLLTIESFEREAGLCSSCGSTVRHRSIIYLLTKYLLGKPQVLRLISPSRSRGIGLSCSSSYAPYLEEKFEYTNTFFDREPQLDINNPSNYDNLDFVISSDVFEHTCPPAIAAFQGSNRILKRKGLLFLTVPYNFNEHTIEHYPECTGYRKIDLENGRKAVELRLRDGPTILDKNPVWHGGQGNTLEMRSYCRKHLLECLKDSSFEILEEFPYGVPSFGIVTKMHENWALPIVARKIRRSPQKWLYDLLTH